MMMLEAQTAMAAGWRQTLDVQWFLLQKKALQQILANLWQASNLHNSSATTARKYTIWQADEVIPVM